MTVMKLFLLLLNFIAEGKGNSEVPGLCASK